MREDTKARLEHWGGARFARLGIWLYVVTRGRLSRVLARRRTLLLPQGRWRT